MEWLISFLGGAAMEKVGILVLAVAIVYFAFFIYKKMKVKKEIREAVLEVAIKTEGVTPEGTPVDKFLEYFIEYYEKELEDNPGPEEKKIAKKEFEKLKKKAG